VGRGRLAEGAGVPLRARWGKRPYSTEQAPTSGPGTGAKVSWRARKCYGRPRTLGRWGGAALSRQGSGVEWPTVAGPAARPGRGPRPGSAPAAGLVTGGEAPLRAWNHRGKANCVSL